MTIEGIRFRAGADGTLVLQVAENVQDGKYDPVRRAWRDATVEDMLSVSRWTHMNDTMNQRIEGLESSLQTLLQRLPSPPQWTEDEFSQMAGRRIA